MMDTEEKVCSKCRIPKPVSEFNRNARTPDGLQRYCRGCHKESSKKSTDRNKEKWSRINPYTGLPYEVKK